MIRLLTILFCIVVSFGAQDPATPAENANQSTSRPQYNFLFIIDTSLSMNARKAGAIKMLRDVITSGFNGQIEPGDSIDIWTFDSANHINTFPPHLWEHEEVHRIATIAARFIEQTKFKGRSNFLPVATDLELLLPHTKNLLAFIITDAEPPVARIQLDLEINEFVAKEKKLRAGSKNPLLISMAATNGRFHEWSVYNGEGELDLATLPARPKLLPAIAEVIPQNVPEPEPKKEPDPEPPIVINYPPGTRITPIVPPKTEPEPVAAAIENVSVIETKKPESAPVEPEPQPVVAATATQPPTDPPAETSKAGPAQEAAIIKKEDLSKPPVPAVAATNGDEKKAEPLVVEAVSSPVTLPSAATSASPEPTEPQVSIPTQAPEPIIALSSPGSSTSVLYIALLTGFSCFALGVYLVLRRLRARHGASIISKSLQQQ